MSRANPASTDESVTVDAVSGLPTLDAGGDADRENGDGDHHEQCAPQPLVWRRRLDGRM